MAKPLTKSFFALFIAQFCGSLNDNFFRITITTLVAFGFIAFNSPAILIYLSLGLFILPYFLFSSLAGQMADKYSKKQLLIWLKIFEVTISLLAIAAFAFQSLLGLLLLIFMTGIQSTFFGPVKYSVIPELLPTKQLLKGNAIVQSSTFVAILIGSILGSKVLHLKHLLFAAPIFMLLNSIIGLIATLYIRNLPSKDRKQQINYNFIVSTIELCKSITKKRSLIVAILGISWLWFTGGVFSTTIPIIIGDLLKLPTIYYTSSLIVLTVGISLGAFVCSYILRDKISSKYVPVSLLLLSIVMFDFSHVLTKLPNNINLLNFYIDLFIATFLSGMYSVPLYTILQSKSPANYRSRNFAVNNIFNALFILLATAFLSFCDLLSLSFAEIFFLQAIANTLIMIACSLLMPKILLESFLRRLLLFLFRVEVSGIENYRKSGERTLIVANHASYLDPVLITIFLRDNLMFAIDTDQSIKWWVKPVLNLVKTFPISPRQPMALKAMINSLQKGHKIVIFPEGRITTTGSLMKVYEGPAMIAEKAGANILPIRISGTEFSIFSKMKDILKLKLFPKIYLDILPAQKITVNKKNPLRHQRYEAGMKLYDLMSNMIFQTQRYYNNLFDALCASAEIFGVNQEIVTDSNNSNLTYKKLIISSFTLAKKITAIESKHIGILMPNTSATVALFFASLSKNKVPVMLNYTSGKFNMLSACHTAKISTIVTSRQFIERASLFELIAAIETQHIKILYLEDIRESISVFDKYSGYWQFIKNKYSYNPKRNEEERNSPAVILFTSGSEGHPKAVVLSHKNIQANIAQGFSRIDFNPNDLVFNSLPIFHCYGLTAGVLLPLMAGIKVYLYPSPLHYKIIPEAVYGIGATILFGTNTFLAKYGKYAHPYDFYTVKYVIAGAEKLKPETQQLWNEKFGIRILEGYGVTETTPVISLNTPMYYKSGKVGRILPGMKYKLKKVPGFKRGGELYVSGPNVMMGYIKHENPDKIVKPAGGYHATGDIAEVDQENFITILGRVKRFAKIGGEMVPLATIEDAVEKLWPLDTHAIISQDTYDRGEKLILVTNYKKATMKKLQKYFKERGLPAFYLPKEIIILDKIPLLGTGKVNYPSLQQLLEARTGKKIVN